MNNCCISSKCLAPLAYSCSDINILFSYCCTFNDIMLSLHCSDACSSFNAYLRCFERGILLSDSCLNFFATLFDLSSCSILNLLDSVSVDDLTLNDGGLLSHTTSLTCIDFTFVIAELVTMGFLANVVMVHIHCVGETNLNFVCI